MKQSRDAKPGNMNRIAGERWDETGNEWTDEARAKWNKNANVIAHGWTDGNRSDRSIANSSLKPDADVTPLRPAPSLDWIRPHFDEKR